ncbi:polysaccharide deacetylase family protein [Akkermansiaceae bacterium]|nr:polysaccharide deacetylase family protein [Akkermansiaceae bacterium]
MKRITSTALTFLASFALLSAQDAPLTLEDDGSRVSVLGYHEFTSGQKLTHMLINEEKFRKQLIAIKGTGVPYISMDQFLKWRRGEGTIPPQSFLMTMDDGWKSVYTVAFPIMKEMNIPFTIFLYKNYVGSHRGGKALSYEMIEEMVASGLCTVGCHSVSHPLPSKMKSKRRQGSDVYDEYLRNEFGESKSFLEEKFRKTVTTFAYPGGHHSPEMFPISDELGYEGLFTVKPGKVSLTTPKHTLPRYIVLGSHDGAFNASIIFRSGVNLDGSVTTSPIELPHPVSPGSGHITPSRLPRISANLSSVEGLDTESIVMRVGGFGKVPAVLNPETKEIAWTVNRPLRQKVCQVSVQWRLKGKTKYEPAMKWNFGVDHVANYQAQ